MALPNVKELRDLIKMLRSQGVLQFNSPDISLVLTELPPIAKRELSSEHANESEELTPEEEAERLLFYSVQSPADTQTE